MPKSKRMQAGVEFVRLFILYRAHLGPASARGISEALMERGIPMSTRSISQFLRSLKNSGYVTSTLRRGEAVYGATRRGHAAVEHARPLLRGISKRIE